MCVLEEERALAEVADEERGEDHQEPRGADGALSEMPHVGVEGLAPRDGEHDRPEHQEGSGAVLREEGGRVRGGQGGEDLGAPHDMGRAEGGHGDEPDERDGAEDRAYARGAPPLKEEEADEERDGDRDHEAVEGVRGHAEALDGAEDGDGRGDHPVAVEEGRAEMGIYPNP